MSMSEVTQIPLNQAKKYITTNVQLQLQGVEKGFPCPVIYISGPPGIGKSDIMSDIANEYGWGLNCQYLGTMQIEQLGLPLPSQITSDSEFARWSLPELYSTMNLRVHPKEGKPIILFLDDMHLASKVMQTYLFQLFTYRSIHNRKMPDNFVMVAAGNRSIDRAGAQPIMAPIVNRIFFLDIKSTHEDWLNNYAIPHNLRNDITSFIEFNPILLQSEPLESSPWASPRSWTYAAQSLDLMESQGVALNRENVLLTCKGHVGLDYATKFVEYRELFMKWRSRDYLQGRMALPDMAKMEKIDQYTFMASLVGEYMKALRAEDFELKSQQIQAYTKVIRDMFVAAAQHAKPLVPMSMRNIIVGQSSVKKSSSIYFHIIKDNEILTNVAKQMMSSSNS